MPNCAISIPKWESEGRPLTPNQTEVSFTMIKNDTLFFEISNTQTVYMYFNLRSSGGSVNYVISIYDAVTFNLVSSVTSTTLNLSTNIDLLAGVYIVCLRAVTGSYTGTAKADYYGYSRVVTFSPTVGESGSEAEFELKTDPKRKECDKAMTWKIVEGKLPIGLSLDSRTGLVYGRLPYLDCIDDPDDAFNTVPSANLFYSSGIDKYETVEPWGRRWNFKLRISITSQPENFDEKWFCILIYNNWTRTQAKFFKEYDNGLIYGDIIKDVDQSYKIGLCDNICPPKENIEIIDEAIKDFLNNGIQITDDDDILHIEIPEIPEFNSVNPNSFDIYTRIDGNITKRKITIENDGINHFGAYTNHQTTIEMDSEILNQRNVYVPEIQSGYISEDLMIEVDSYDQYLSFRQYSRYAKDNPQTKVYEHRGSELFNAFMNLDSNVKYEYISYDPALGVDGVEDSKDLSDHFQQYIYIYYENVELPEANRIEEMNNKQLEKAPIMFEMLMGESAEFSLTRIGKNNEII